MVDTKNTKQIWIASFGLDYTQKVDIGHDYSFNKLTISDIYEDHTRHSEPFFCF